MSDTEWLIAREIPRLRRYALALADSPEAADDLVQDTLERALKKHHLWRRQGSIRSWLYRIQFNIFVNQGARRARRRMETSLDDAEWSQSEPPRQEDRVACQDITEAMRRLPRDQRAAIALTVIEGLSYDEAAEALGVPIGTLRSRLSRGREKLMELHPDAPPVHLRRVK